MNQRILVENGLLHIPASDRALSNSVLATILSNIAYYGFALSEAAYAKLTSLDNPEAWWTDVEATLKSITGADKKMADFVVYKNFPREVLEMSEAEYWTKQILMYWGFPNDYFTEVEESRKIKKEKLPLKILQPANDNSLSNIFNSLLSSRTKWTSGQKDNVQYLVNTLTDSLDFSSISFKENLVALALMLSSLEISVKSATDVLRLAAGMSDGDISLRTNTKFRRFKRKERRFLLDLLEKCRNLDEDVARRSETFKRLFFETRPGDYGDQYPNVKSAYDKVYRSIKIKTFNSELEKLISEHSSEALDLLKTRPGEFLRRLRVATKLYGNDAVTAFKEVMPRLTVQQLVKIERQLITANDRIYRTFPPKGNWTKLKVVKTTEQDQWDDSIALELSDFIANEVGRRVNRFVPFVNLSPSTEKVKLQGNDADLSPFGRGTVFDIPKSVTFLRSASYWKTGGGHYGNVWFDNGWNFFNDNWQSMGSCCWNQQSLGKAAVFSGDPTNSKEMKGRACQMIDLYLDKLAAVGVRYAVWNILCYSNKSFDEAEDVHAALQWGEDAQANKLFEPSRCALSFPIKGSSMTKYIAYVDVAKRQLVYMDANLYGRVQSASSNEKILSETMPAFVEYLHSLPSVHDLFKKAPASEDGIPIVYDDTDNPVVKDQAYVFLQRNKDSKFNALDLNKVLKG